MQSFKPFLHLAAASRSQSMLCLLCRSVLMLPWRKPIQLPKLLMTALKKLSSMKRKLQVFKPPLSPRNHG